MRMDVKLGVAVSAAIVLTVGGYLAFRGGTEKPIPVADVKNSEKSPSTSPTAASPVNSGRPKTGGNPAAMPNAQKLASRQPMNRPQPAVEPPNAGVTQPDRVGQPVGTSAGSAIPTGVPADRGASSPASVAAVPPTSGAQSPASSPSVSRPSSPQPAASSPTPLTGSVPVSAPLNAGKPAEATTAPDATTGGVKVAETPSPSGSAPTSPASSSQRSLSPPVGSPTLSPTSPTPTIRSTQPAADDMHRAQAGDTLTSLSQTYYGSGKHAALLKKANPSANETGPIAVGTAIRIPPLPAEADAKPAATKGAEHLAGATASPKSSAAGERKTYVVKSGDSFYRIAKEQLGNSTRWKELLKLNEKLVNGDPTNLRAGQTIALPES